MANDRPAKAVEFSHAVYPKIKARLVSFPVQRWSRTKHTNQQTLTVELSNDRELRTCGSKEKPAGVQAHNQTGGKLIGFAVPAAVG